MSPTLTQITPPQTTTAQIEANRKNAQASTGPRTPEGKARCARNAIAWGLFSARVLVAPEEAAEYETLRLGLASELQPVTLLEQAFATEILHAMWRLRRCEIVESDLNQTAVDRARAQAANLLRRSLAELRRLQTARTVQTELGEDESLVSRKEVLDAKLLARRVHGLDRFEAILQDADRKMTEQTQSVPRNAPCPCGSGHKYKRCCGNHAPPVLHVPVPPGPPPPH